MSALCPVCGRQVRVSKGVLVKHPDRYGHACDNAGCSVDAIRRAEAQQ